ncbi:MAG TPA: ABC transporter permease [Candidatus Alistipes merdigallinarum]|nr:ABC transporter permease [Candidatus Alistipes merdigallinarum]
MKTLFILLDKEVRQFIRNSFMPKLVLIFPLMIMLIMPWVTTMDVRHINVSVVDQDHSSASRRLIQKINASDYFSLVQVSEHYEESFRQLEANNADVIIEIPDRFGESLVEGSAEKLRITANGVNAMKGGIGAQYTTQTAMQTLSELLAEEGSQLPNDTFVIENRYNPTLEYRNYMIPALMIMLLIMLCGFLPSLNLVGEKEVGTIEQINVTPVGRFTFTLAKLIPYWVIGLIVLSIAMLLAYIIYGLSPVGSFGAIYLAAILFILTMSGLGVTIANGSSTMQQAMFVMFFFVMVFVLMSGLITPIASMPEWAQWITRFLPPRYFIEIMQAVYLKGTSINELWQAYTALTLFATLFDLLAAVTYKKQT